MDYAAYLEANPVDSTPAAESRWQVESPIRYLNHDVCVIRYPGMSIEVDDEVYFEQYGSQQHRGRVVSVNDEWVGVYVWSGYKAHVKREAVYLTFQPE